jgi:hypothetical protein
MKAKGNDHRLLVQSKWRKTDKKKKTSLAATGFTRCSARLSIRLLVSSIGVIIEFHTPSYYIQDAYAWALNFEISAGACSVIPIVQRYELSPVDISEIGMLCGQASCIR